MMKKENKNMSENLEMELLPHFKGLSEKTTVKIIRTIEKFTLEVLITICRKYTVSNYSIS
jgi:hypothetical protein